MITARDIRSENVLNVIYAWSTFAVQDVVVYKSTSINNWMDRIWVHKQVGLHIEWSTTKHIYMLKEKHLKYSGCNDSYRGVSQILEYSGGVLCVWKYRSPSFFSGVFIFPLATEADAVGWALAPRAAPVALWLTVLDEAAFIIDEFSERLLFSNAFRFHLLNTSELIA